MDARYQKAVNEIERIDFMARHGELNLRDTEYQFSRVIDRYADDYYIDSINGKSEKDQTIRLKRRTWRKLLELTK